MIFIKNGSMSISGTKLTLMAELTTMMKSMIDKDIIDEKDLRFLVDTALMTSEELHEKVENIKKDDELDDILDKLEKIAEILS